jgi:hypothetical protein
MSTNQDTDQDTDQDRADKLAAAASLAADIGAARGAVFGEQLAALRAYLDSFEEAVKAALATHARQGRREADRQRLARPWQDLKTTGLLWLINAAVLHPRGYALALVYRGGDHDEPIGWQLLGDGSEAWVFLNEDSQDPFTNVESFLAAHRD